MSEEQKRSLPTVDADTENRIQHIRIFALDMDGTIYLGENWIDGAKRFLERIQETGREYFFLTNNSSKNPKAYVEKLGRMGFSTDLDHVISSGQATVWYLQKNYPKKKVFLLGNELLRAEFAEAGIDLTGSGVGDNSWQEAQLVVTGFDTTLDYAKMCQVCDLVRKGVPYIATHPDFNCPTETGFIPDIGAIAAFIQASTGRKPDTVVGKPYEPIAQYLLERVEMLRQKKHPEMKDATVGFGEIAMVGDRLYTDVACGVNAGMTGILVLSGEATLEDARVSEVRPDLIYHSVREIDLG